ncbi:MAG: nucleotidyl transferase AbiEii/AbiGii toxin family protein [Deltaproteobacteria bacterium]|nr:nucleotidyl transferase AbiEii/AbiGii toxin family protein [Deltaproteobacteria bacterium]
MLTEAELRREAAATGFGTEVLEKVIRLLELLDTLRMHPFLKPRIVLKGGTALNLFVFDVPRLSVDIDLNYIGAANRETMLADRPKVEQAIQAVCGRLGIQVKRAPSEHAGGKWRLSYTTITRRPGTLELDMNFMLRTPLWPHAAADSGLVEPFAVTGIPILDVHELAAGKLAALFGRSASRDLFDVREILRRGDLDRTKLRLGFVVYGGINRRDWREVSLDDVQTNPDEVDRQLVPLLRGDMAPDRDHIQIWTEQLVADCRDLLSAVLPFEPQEREFLNQLNDRGDIAAELLTKDAGLQSVIQAHPALLWKALNVKKHFGTSDQDKR